jgi:glycosyltransferase involved in cell wall biosynthesis
VKILKLHNHYRLVGGESHSAAAEASLLARAGHEVAFLTVDNAMLTRWTALAAGLQSPWNWFAYRAVRSRIRETRPDLLAVHNFFPLLSPAVYYAAHAEGVAVVQSLHNYRMICPAATLFRQGRPCETCITRPFPWPGVVHRCYRNSLAATSSVALTHVLHRYLGTWTDKVDLYIAPSNFVRNRFLEAGFPAGKIVIKPNFVMGDPGIGEGSGGFVLYAGRLAPEKGVATLLEAARRLRIASLLRIAGDGPLVEPLSTQHPAAQWLGMRTPNEIFFLMKRAAVLVFPSTCPESFGRTVIEAFAAGTPVIASNIGALPELVEHGRTGLLFRPGDAEDLAAKLEWFLSHPRQARAMRREARAEFEAKYTAERNYPILMEIYERAIRHRQTAGAKPIPAPDDSRHAGGCDQLCRGHAAGAGVGPAR